MVAARSNEQIQQLIREQINLPSPPAIAVQILSTVQDRESSLEDLEKIISADPALTGKMLRIANSAFYSLPNKVSNIARAMSILGTNVIKNIALSFVISRDLRGDKTSHFKFDLFWKRSVTTAVAAKLLTKLLHRKDDDIFVTALLQDLGVLIFYLSKGSKYNKILEECGADGDCEKLIKLEEQKYQFNHQQLSHLLIRSWGLPYSVSEPIHYHHKPDNAPYEYRQTAKILYVANLLSAIYNGRETTENVQLLQVELGELLGFNPEQTKELLDDVAQNSIDILDIFELAQGEMKPYSQMLQEANDELGRLNLSYEQLVMALQESKAKAERFANELQTANAKLQNMAFRDSLTGLYNFRYFQDILGKELARSTRYKSDISLVLFDIDFFKTVNDNYGHPAGDQVLINLSKQIQKTIRPSDIIARYGGEEFALILPETNKQGMMEFAERLRRLVMGITTVVDDIKISVTISLGGVHFDPSSSKVNKLNLIDTADRALYKSKQNGRNMVTTLPLN